MKLEKTFPKITTISKVCTVADFTDGGSTSGYIDFSELLPSGAIPIAWKAVVTGAFKGDTSATISVGVSGDTDRFSADTSQSVFAAGTVGSFVLAADALDGIASVQTPRVTVTSATDFTTVVTDATGAMVVFLYYIKTV